MSMTALSRFAAIAVCVLTLVLVVIARPVQAQGAEPYNPADAARKYCGRSFKRYCASVPAAGVQALDCLKQHVKQLPPNCRKAVQAL
jgi:hypothetical protein